MSAAQEFLHYDIFIKVLSSQSWILSSLRGFLPLSFTKMMFPKATVSLLLSKFGLSYPTDTSQNHNATSLNWKPCDLDFPPSHQNIVAAHGVPVLCANLQVPLDYTNNESGKTIDLQLVKVKATKEPFKGSIIMNPGGPGASGVEEISKKGPMYRDVFGGHFDVIGFDARSVWRTFVT